jgi:hypothetical protein
LKKGGGAFIKNVPKEGITVRFMTEPEEWINYKEHYDPELKAYYPCIEGDCPGCEQNIKTSKRYLTNAIDREDDRVVPLKLPADAANRVVIKFDKYGTILDRDYTIERFGEGLDTKYEVSPEAPEKIRLSKYEPLDLMKALKDSWNNAFGEDDDEDDEDEDEEPVRKRRPVAKSALKRKTGVSSKKKTSIKRSVPSKSKTAIRRKPNRK